MNSMNRKQDDGRTRLTVFVALAANLLIAAAKVVGGLISGSAADLVPERAHGRPQRRRRMGRRTAGDRPT